MRTSPHFLRAATTALCCVIASLVSIGEARQAKGKKYALLVGVAEYKGDGFSKLKYTERDVEELAKVLTSAGYEVRVLTTKSEKKSKADVPTAENIRKAFTALIKGRARGDTVLLALSGHGLQIDVKDPKGEKEPLSYGYFCPTDADTTDIKYSTGYSENLILVDDLFEGMGKCQATNKLILMDACRNETSRTASSRNVNVEATKVPKGVAALFGCSREQKAWEHDDLKHGVFFHYILEGMRGKAKNEDEEVTWDLLSAYVKRQVQSDVPKRIGQGARQVPHGVNSLEGDPVLLVAGRNNQPATKTRTPKKYAFLAGINEYAKLKPLKYAGNDAEKLGKLLKDKLKFDEVVILTSERGKQDKKLNPTAENIREQLKSILANKEKEDLILIGLAGDGKHGRVADPKIKAGDKRFTLFCPSDADFSDPIDLNTGKSVSLLNLQTELFEPMGKCGAGLKVFLIDACRDEKEIKVRNAKSGNQPIPDNVVDLTIPENVVGMFSCAKGQYAWETQELQHGVFFYHVIKALEGEALDKDGVITWSRLSGYVEKNTSQYVENKIGNGARQTPHVFANVKASPTLFKNR